MFKHIKELFSATKKPAKRHHKALQYEELEQRVLFSADFVPGLDNIAVDEQVLVQDVTNEFPVEREAAPETVEQTAAEQRRELVLVNEDVADYEQLITDLQASDNNRTIEVVVLESDRDCNRTELALPVGATPCRKPVIFSFTDVTSPPTVTDSACWKILLSLPAPMWPPLMMLRGT